MGLGGSPNFWSKDEVDNNLRRLVAGPRFSVTDYDPKSIMHYALPAWMFKAGADSICFVPENNTLSDLDRTIIKTAYPASEQDQQKFLVASGERIENVLKKVGITQSQAKAIADLAKGIVEQAHPNLGFVIRTENLQKNSEQHVNGDCNDLVQEVQGSTVTIKRGDCKK